MGWRKKMKKFVVHRALEITLHGEEMNWKIYYIFRAYQLWNHFYFISFSFVPFYDTDHTSEIMTLVIHLKWWHWSYIWNHDTDHTSEIMTGLYWNIHTLPTIFILFHRQSLVPFHIIYTVFIVIMTQHNETQLNSS